MGLRKWHQSVKTSEEGVEFVTNFRGHIRRQDFKWGDIVRFGFIDGGLATDVYQLYLRDRKGPIEVCSESEGASGIWDELSKRGFLPEGFRNDCIHSADGQIRYWPPREDE